VTTHAVCDVAVIGGGPAGLMAAETAAAAGATVTVFDAMPSCGRKFLVAGKGGLNLTHREQGDALTARYSESPHPNLSAALAAFDSQALRNWAAALGIETFVGSSGRVFPTDLKAAPLLRRWLARLRREGVAFALRQRWLGWTDAGLLRFQTPAGDGTVDARATVLALGGASWPRLGADGRWVDILAARGVDIAPLCASNVGFECDWSAHLRERHAGAAIKNVMLSCADASGRMRSVPGDLIITGYGLEGGCLYALSAYLRAACSREGTATLLIDLLPGHALERLRDALAQAHGKRSFAEQLRRAAGLGGAAAALIHETLPREARDDPGAVAAHIKGLALVLRGPRPLTEAISTAGGVRFAALTGDLMVRALPGVFVAGEMLDWDAPTGGYLLTACYATGRTAGAAAGRWRA